MDTLIEELKAAVKGDELLDCKVWGAVYLTPSGVRPPCKVTLEEGGRYYRIEWPTGQTQQFARGGIPAVTTSLEAAVALAEGALPTWDWGCARLSSGDGTPYRASMIRTGKAAGRLICFGPTAALALTRAVCAAYGRVGH